MAEFTFTVGDAAFLASRITVDTTKKQVDVFLRDTIREEEQSLIIASWRSLIANLSDEGKRPPFALLSASHHRMTFSVSDEFAGIINALKDCVIVRASGVKETYIPGSLASEMEQKIKAPTKWFRWSWGSKGQVHEESSLLKGSSTATYGRS